MPRALSHTHTHTRTHADINSTQPDPLSHLCLTGTKEERGLDKWKQSEDTFSEGEESHSVYDLPFIQPWLNKLACTKYVPICPGFRGDKRRRRTPSANEQVNEAFEPCTTKL